MPLDAVFAGVLLPLLFTLAAWAAVVAGRLIADEHDRTGLPPSPGPARPVRAREIRQTVRHLEYRLRAAEYRYERGRGSHLPRAWVSDASRRTN